MLSIDSSTASSCPPSHDPLASPVAALRGGRGKEKKERRKKKKKEKKKKGGKKGEGPLLA